MAKRSVKRDKSVVNPMFYIPEGVDELTYGDQEIVLGEVLDEYRIDEIIIDDDYVDGEEFEDYSEVPDVPDIIGIVSQTIRTTSTGNQVVDVVIEVEDIDDQSKYDIRVTKI